MFEIWRDRGTGERYLVVVRDGMVIVAAGPLARGDDPRQVLATHGNQQHNPVALLAMRRLPGAYIREYTTDRTGQVVAVADPTTEAIS
jgi:hypothetical protein